MNAGFVGLAINCVLTVLISLRTKPKTGKKTAKEDRDD
jgi:hypothetical protein